MYPWFITWLVAIDCKQVLRQSVEMSTKIERLNQVAVSKKNYPPRTTKTH